ncbi:cytochrome c oxidase accessory protein CcoG [Oligella ureolytica]
MSEKNSSNLPENSQEAPKWQPPQPEKDRSKA